jgi:tryptophan-rich sensory protein
VAEFNIDQEIMNIPVVVKLLVSLLLPLGVGGVAGMFTASAIPTWYATLARPSFAPPNWLFGPAWTVLYIAMGISLFLVWNSEPGKARTAAMVAFGVQLVLNFAWSFIFFYYKQLGLALIEIVAMWVAILVMMILFYQVRPLSAYLNIPYLLWVSFATALNFGFYKLN